MQYPYLQGKIVMAFSLFRHRHRHRYRKYPSYIILHNNVEVSIANLDYSAADGYIQTSRRG